MPGRDAVMTNSYPSSSLGETIKARRRELGLSQKMLAARVVAQDDYGFRQSDVSRLERGRVDLPRRRRLEHLAAALELSSGMLLASSGWAEAETACGEERPEPISTDSPPATNDTPLASPVSPGDTQRLAPLPVREADFRRAHEASGRT
jgi:transcriptional regulator with XRE-family HTH domain